MRVLALDTALDACAAGVLDTERGDLVASETIPMARGHAEALLPLIARVMDTARLDFADLDRIAVTVGPGSFTGVRVGIAAARGIALAAAKPAIGLTTLAAFTAPHVVGGFAGTVIPVIDARHGHVYMQVFGPGGRAAIPPRLAALREVVEEARSRAPTLITGSAAALVAAEWPADEPAPQIVVASAPEIGWVARLGAAAQPDRAPPKPLYLRPPDARPQDAARISHQ